MSVSSLRLVIGYIILRVSSDQIAIFGERLPKMMTVLFYTRPCKFCLMAKSFKKPSKFNSNYCHWQNLKFCTNSGTIKILANFWLLFKFSHFKLWNLSFCVWKHRIHSESLQNPKIWCVNTQQNVLRICVSFCGEAERLIQPVGKLKQKAKFARILIVRAKSPNGNR